MLRLSHLRKAFGATVAVDDLSLEVRRGEVFGLLGPNGAGKTTTISMIVGLLRPDAGTVELETTPGAPPASPTDPAVRMNIGVAPQALAVYDEMTGAENLEFFGTMYGLSGPPLRARVEELLEMTGLTEKRRARVATYSGGMKRRINLAAAMVHDPPLLLFDEATAGVDPQSRNAIFDIIESLRRKGRTIVYTTHYMEEAQRLCDRVAIIDKGRVLALDTVEGLIASHGGSSIVTVRRANGEERVETKDPMAELARLIQAPGMMGVRVDRPDLEVVFLSLTGRSLRD